jgi:molecular chaperone DnaK (HSP70)
MNLCRMLLVLLGVAVRLPGGGADGQPAPPGSRDPGTAGMFQTTDTGRVPATAPRLAEDVGIKTVVGFTPLIRKGVALPAEYVDDFSTAEDNQARVEIQVFATGADRFPRDLGVFYIDGIEPAPRGMPRIRVVLRVDESGAVEIAARHLPSGRIQRVQLGRVGTTME